MQHEENGEFGGFLFIDHEETLEKKIIIFKKLKSYLMFLHKEIKWLIETCRDKFDLSAILKINLNNLSLNKMDPGGGAGNTWAPSS